MAHSVVVAFFHVKVNLLDYVLALFILLARLVRFGIGPSHHAFATSTEDVTNTVQSCDQHSVLCRTNCDVNTLVEQVSSAMATMETLGDDVIVTSQMRSTLGTSINLWSIEVHHRVIYPLS